MARCLVRQITVTNLTWSCGFVLRDVTFLILQWLVKYRCTNVTPLRRRQPLHTVERPVANKSGPYTFGLPQRYVYRGPYFKRLSSTTIGPKMKRNGYERNNPCPVAWPRVDDKPSTQKCCASTHAVQAKTVTGT